MRRVALVVCAFGALVVQLALVVIVVGPWVSAWNAAGGECGYDSTCIDDGFDAAVIWGWLLLPAEEVGVALLVSVVRSRPLHPDDRPGRRSWMAIFDTICWTVCLGCGGLLILTAQSVLFDRLASLYAGARCPTTNWGCADDTTRARLFRDLSGAAVLVEIMAAVIVGQRMAARRAGRNHGDVLETS